MPWEITLIIIAVLVIGVVLYLHYFKKKTPVLVAPSPELKYLVVKIPNNSDNELKVYSLKSDQIVCVFLNDKFVESINSDEFSISKYASLNHLNTKDIKFCEYHFYVFNESIVYDLGLKMEIPMKFVDVDYALPISVLPKGRVSFKYVDIPLLFKELNLFRSSYTYSQLFDEIRSRLQLLVSRGIIQFCYEKKITMLLLNFYLDDIDSHMKNIIDSEFEKLGLVSIKVEFIDFSVDQADDIKKIDSIIMKNLKYRLLNYSYTDEKKIQLMKNIKFVQKATVDKTTFEEEVKKTV